MSDLFADLPDAGAPPALDPRSRELAIRTVLGEAANEPPEGQAGVAAVIRNRMQSGQYGGSDVPRVVTAKNQFEPWNTQAGRERMFSYAPDSEPYQRAGAAVDRVFGEGYDPTSGATHFYSPTTQAALGRQTPAWAQGEGQSIGRHTFFAPEGRVQVASNAVPGLFDDLPGTSTGQGERPAAAQTVGAGRAAEPIPEGIPRITVTPGGGGQFMAPLPDGGNARVAREGMSPPVATKGGAAFGGFADAATFNFSDEVKGILAAGGIEFDKDGQPKNLDQPVDVAFAKGAYRLATGDADAKAAYQTITSQTRERVQREQEQQPGAYLAGQIGGAAASLPIGGAGGATLGARTLQGARAGAAYGAISGAGEGTDLESRGLGAATGGATGTVLGAAAPAALELGIQGARLASAPLRSTAQAIRGAFNPDAEAARRVVGALQNDVRTAGGPPGLTAPEFAQSVNSGGPAAIMDLGGDTTRALARSAANTSPEARTALNAAINDRFESQSDRVSGWLQHTFGPADTGATREALQDAARAANRPAYRQAYREGDQPLWSPQLQQLASSPDVVDAMRAAAQKGKSRAVVEGFGGFNSSVQISPSGVVNFTRGANGQPTYPNLQFWDYTKRALDDAANAARRAGRNDEASVLGQLSTSLRGELDNIVPSYQAARAGAARFFGANDALDAGERFLSSNMPLADARRAFAQMSPAERDLFQHGFVQSLTQKIEAAPDRRNVLNAIAQSPRAREQIDLAMGPQHAREFEGMMRVEGIMDLARTSVQGNSTTARQLVELGLAGGAYGIGGLGALNQDPASLVTAALLWGASRGHRAIDQRVARRVGEMLASNDPAVLRQGVNIVGRSRGFLEALRSFDLGVAKAGTTQASPPAVQALGRLNASEDQQNVPGPPGQ